MNPLVSPEPHVAPHAGRTALSVNVNKVALLRNTRHLGIPSVVKAATLCLQAGADGITVHPRPDERHIRAHDVHELAALMQQWPQAEYNIEGNPFHNLMGFARELVAKGLPLHQLTFVPDSEGQFTSDHGWDLEADYERLRPLIAECRALGVRVSLFMDPQPRAMALARSLGASRVELYTEPYAAAHLAAHAASTNGANGAGVADLTAQLAAFSATAQAALAAGLGVNAGHDLNRDNLADFLRAVPGLQEVSIGHALVADALELGLTQTVRDYQRCIRMAHTSAAAGA